MRVASNELKSQKRAPVFVPIFHAPALGMALGNLDGGSFLDEILGLRHERACERAACDCPEKPIGIRYDYLRKGFTFVRAKIQCCPAHLSTFKIVRFLPLRCRRSIRAGTRPVFKLAISEMAFLVRHAPTRRRAKDVSAHEKASRTKLPSRGCVGQDAARTSPQPR
jgi:hypothetical protein